MKVEEIEKNGLTYVRETYDNGTVIEYTKSEEEEELIPTEPELTTEEIIEEMAMNIELLTALAEINA